MAETRQARAKAPVLQFVPAASKRRSEVVAVLKGLLEAAETGVLHGFAFGSIWAGNRIYLDAVGELRRDQVKGLGIATMLTAEIERRIYSESEEEVL